MDTCSTHYATSGIAVCCLILAATTALANENVVHRASQATGTVNDTDQAFNRELDSPTQLSPVIRSILGLPNSDLGPEGFGTANHPFTTQRASTEDSIEPVDKYPWRATGKLLMKFANGDYVCTASVIGKSLLVTAAHCVHEYGMGEQGFAESISFEPARHEQKRPFGVWTAKEWWIPKAYHDGTDICSKEAPGTVCQNDLAVIVVNENEGKAIGDVVGMYNLPKEPEDHEFGYTNFLLKKSAHITQLGYPSKDYDGNKLIRTDSLGYQDEPNNVIIGSNQTGGSSGGPWLQNFGVATSYKGIAPFDAQLNTVVAVTSWGYTSGVVKVQGSSRFAKNAIYTNKMNIRSLVDDVCEANPGAC